MKLVCFEEYIFTNHETHFSRLGAKHDFEVGSDCGLEEQPGRKRLPQKLSSRIPENADEVEIQQDTIMSGILYFELYPFRWSACSRENIRFFLS